MMFKQGLTLKQSQVILWITQIIISSQDLYFLFPWLTCSISHSTEDLCPPLLTILKCFQKQLQDHQHILFQSQI